MQWVVMNLFVVKSETLRRKTYWAVFIGTQAVSPKYKAEADALAWVEHRLSKLK